MNCPKCGAHNDDAAACCSLCYEAFTAKPKAAYPKSRLEMIAFPGVACRYEHWVLSGPLVIGLNGFHFFIEEIRNTKPTAGQRMGGSGAGGWLLGKAIDAAVESATGPRSERPDKIDLRPTVEILDQCAPVLAEVPAIAKCKEYFRVDKKEIKSLSFGFWGGLSLKASWIELEINGVKPEEKASAFFKTKGYPYEG
jgi:hypothetical protein